MSTEQLEAQKEKASKTLATMLDYLGLDAKLKVVEKGSKIAILVASDEAGRIIGRKGQTLESLQLLLNRMMFKADQEFPRIHIDIDGYARKGGRSRPADGEECEEGAEGEECEEREEREERRGRYERSERSERPRRFERGERSERTGAHHSRNSEEEEETLRQQALDAAKEVKRWGESVTLPEMNSHDRRIIHITLQDDEELVTESIGDGNLKKIVISVKK